jgi:sulfate transport system ATP-binding protein
MSITLKDVSKSFGAFRAVNNVTLEVPTGGLVALLGPSGSGKTTLLRIIAGLEEPDGGTVWFDAADITRQRPGERNVGFVFQHYALFRHMTVFENIAFGLRVRKRPNAEVRTRVGELLRLIRLEELGGRMPSQLSGGQRQRVALARALAVEPKVLLLDEPFGALDAKVRQELRQWLRRLHDEIHTTSVFVTHDQEEAFEVADSVVVMREGGIEQIGSPYQLFDNPANAFVMDFLGNVNVFHGRLTRGRFQTLGGLDLDVPETPDGATEPVEASLYIRPHDFNVALSHPPGSHLAANVVHVNAAGPVAKLRLLTPETEQPIQVEMSTDDFAQLRPAAGQVIYLTPRRMRVFRHS